MTQQDLAAASGLHRVAIANIERGNRGKAPPLDTVVKLAAALGVSIETLTTAMPSESSDSSSEPTPNTRRSKPDSKPARRKTKDK